MKFVENLSRTFGRTMLKAKKHSPEVLIVTGAIGFVGTVVLACKATRKLDSVLDEAKESIDQIHKASEDETLKEKYTEEDSKKDLTITYAKTGFKLVKLYGPTIALGTASLFCMFASHNILTKRNIGLAAAYATIDKGFKEYRGRVVERFGDQVDKELKYNIKAEKFTKENDDLKEEFETSDTVDIARPDTASDYSKFFDESCPDWKSNPEYNLMFLKMQERHANDLLKARGHIFLNEVYDMLGLPRTTAGQVVGWIYDEGNPIGDNYVDFGLYDLNRTKTRDFVNGYESVVLLDFNVDGSILDLI